MNFDPLLRKSLEALGLPLVAPEPEVLAADLTRIQCNTLASFIERLLADEPLLKVERDGATLTVREIGGSGVMRFTVEGARE